MGVELRKSHTSTPTLALPDETTSQSTKPASGQVAGYLHGGGDDALHHFTSLGSTTRITSPSNTPSLLACA